MTDTNNFKTGPNTEFTPRSEIQSGYNASSKWSEDGLKHCVIFNSKIKEREIQKFDVPKNPSNKIHDKFSILEENPATKVLTRKMFNELSEVQEVKMYQIRNEASKHMTRLTTKNYPFYKFYQLKEDSESDQIVE